MKKYLLTLFIFTLALVFAGCGKNELKGSYEKMKISKNLESYQLDLRIYGTYNNKGINEIVRIDNYKGTQYKVDYISKNTKREDSKDRKEEKTKEAKDTALYVIDGVMYRIDEMGSYKKTTEESLYTKPELYLGGLKNLNDDDYLREETVASNKYKVYSITVSKENMKAMLKNSVLSDISLKNDVTGEVWLDKDGFAYKIIYNVNTGMEDTKTALTINASYFRINNVAEIKTQLNIK